MGDRPAARASASKPIRSSRWRRLPVFALPVVLALTLSSCAYFQGAIKARDAGGPVPWWCTSTEDIPVTDGPAAGNIDWYAGITRLPSPGTTA